MGWGEDSDWACRCGCLSGRTSTKRRTFRGSEGARIVQDAPFHPRPNPRASVPFQRGITQWGGKGIVALIAENHIDTSGAAGVSPA